MAHAQLPGTLQGLSLIHIFRLKCHGLGQGIGQFAGHIAPVGMGTGQYPAGSGMQRHCQAGGLMGRPGAFLQASQQGRGTTGKHVAGTAHGQLGDIQGAEACGAVPLADQRPCAFEDDSCGDGCAKGLQGRHPVLLDSTARAVEQGLSLIHI